MASQRRHRPTAVAHRPYGRDHISSIMGKISFASPPTLLRLSSAVCFREPRNRARHGRPEQDLVVVVGPADYYPFDKGWRIVSHPSTQLGRNDRVPVPVNDGHRYLAV